ncbi:hypothetical protein L1987_65064 [Smallanthus sonchifolius]|uniref:Uncharacterized protein n=1 Tax=Smallanthus sonchifolius TaxID=185202 RepID=A0ACB9BTB3_9ASTR|nr:hypothetical protein L1987_65064 [Smallanthus sonchifolius]
MRHRRVLAVFSPRAEPDPSPHTGYNKKMHVQKFPVLEQPPKDAGTFVLKALSKFRDDTHAISDLILAYVIPGIRASIRYLSAYDMIRNLKERYHQDYNKDPSYSLMTYIKDVALENPDCAMIMRNLVAYLEKACVPIDYHFVIDNTINDTFYDYRADKLLLNHFDELRDFISWYPKFKPEDALKMIHFVDQLERIRVYPSDDIIRAMFNVDLHKQIGTRRDC